MKMQALCEFVTTGYKLRVDILRNQLVKLEEIDDTIR